MSNESDISDIEYRIVHFPLKGGQSPHSREIIKSLRVAISDRAAQIDEG